MKPTFLLILSLLLACSATGYAAPAAPAPASDMETKLERTWNADAVIILNIKDENGGRLTAKIRSSEFVAQGPEGYGTSREIEVNGFARIEYHLTHAADLMVYRDGYTAIRLSFDFTDLQEPWSVMPDGKTILIRRDVVLVPYVPPQLSVEFWEDLDYDRFTQKYTVGNLNVGADYRQYERIRVSSLTFADQAPDADFFYVEIVDDPTESGGTSIDDGNHLFFPAGKKVVLHLKSDDPKAGVFFSGVFSTYRGPEYGNFLPEAPEEGYVAEYPLEKEWFLNSQLNQPCFYFRCHDYYGKLVLTCARLMPRGDYHIVIGIVMNTEKKRDLRTTFDSNVQ